MNWCKADCINRFDFGCSLKDLNIDKDGKCTNYKKGRGEYVEGAIY